MNLTVSSKSTKAKQLAPQGIEQNLPPKQMRRPLPLLLSPSFFYVCTKRSGWRWGRNVYLDCLLFAQPCVVRYTVINSDLRDEIGHAGDVDVSRGERSGHRGLGQGQGNT